MRMEHETFVSQHDGVNSIQSGKVYSNETALIFFSYFISISFATPLHLLKKIILIELSHVWSSSFHQRNVMHSVIVSPKWNWTPPQKKKGGTDFKWCCFHSIHLPSQPELCSSAEEPKLLIWPCYLVTSLHLTTSITYPFPGAPKGTWLCWTESQFTADWWRTDAACVDDDVSGRCAVVYFWVAGCCVVGVPGCGSW